MGNKSSVTEIDSLSDRTLIEHLLRSSPTTISELVEYAGVTATAIRQRLNRLMDEGLVERKAERAGRGRPTHWYSLTSAGERSAGHNYEDLASVLWKEIRAVEDPDIRYGLLKRIAERMAESYRNRITGDDLFTRMDSLAKLMQERDIPFEVNMVDQLPILTALACPYPDLAEQDQSICSMEKMLFSEILGESVRLSNCRLNSEGCCTFQASASQPAQV